MKGGSNFQISGWHAVWLAQLRKGIPVDHFTLLLYLTRNFLIRFYWSRRGLYRFDSVTVKYGVHYTGRTFETALLEVFGDSWMKSRMEALTFLKEFEVCEIALGHRLKVVNLSGKRLNPLGIDANIFASLAYDSTQRWAAAFMEHPDAPNGIRYPSSKKRALTQFRPF